MRILNLFLCFCGIWFFAACSTSVPADTTMNFEVVYDAQPQGAAIYCNGNLKGISPYTHTMSIDYEKFKKIKANKGKYTQMDCKAVWASGKSANFNRKGNLKDFDKNMKKTEKLIRGKDGDLNLDILAEKRAYNIEGAILSGSKLEMYLYTPNDTSTIYCSDDSESVSMSQVDNPVITKIDILKVLKSGILEVRQCKAVFDGAITKYFKNKINLDKENISVLGVQSLYLSEQEKAKIALLQAQEEARIARLKAQEEARLALLAEQEKRQKCLNGDFDKCNGYKDIENLCMKGRSSACLHLLGNQDKYNIKCPNYLKITKKACDLKVGDACVLLGDEYHPISTRDYGGKWRRNYGSNCSLANERQAYALYKKACDLGSSEGCDRHNELDMIIMEIGERKDDKIRKYDYTIRHR